MGCFSSVGVQWWNVLCSVAQKKEKGGGGATTKEQLQAQDPLLSSGKTDEKRGRFE